MGWLGDGVKSKEEKIKPVLFVFRRFFSGGLLISLKFKMAL